MIDLFSVKKKYRVYVPSKLILDKYVGFIYGYYHESTGIFNITGTSSVNGEEIIGEIVSEKTNTKKDSLLGYWKDDKLFFIYQDEEYDIAEYTLEKNLFSRNTGILETNWMLDKCAFLLGCGSV